jgi:transcription termination factor Rho
MRTRGRGGPSRGGQFNRGPNRHSNHHSGHYGGHRSPRSSEAPVYDPNQEPAPENGEAVALEPFVGVLEMHPNGYGFLRDPKNNYNRERTDPFVPGTMIEKFRLREGVLVNGMMQQNRRQQGPRLREIIDVDGMPPEEYSKVKDFDSLTAVNPDEWLRLETGPLPLTTRVMDLLTPLGKGQRALIVSPPRAGKTIMLQHISQAISANYPELKLIVLLVDERPEEVTDMRRNVDGEVVASSLDREVESLVRMSKLVVESCRRLAVL